MFKFLTLLTAFLVLPVTTVEAKPRKRPSGKAVASSFKRPKAGKAKGKVSAHNSRRRTSTAAVHPASPPRQRTPTAERYQEIQQALAAKGYYSGPVTGVWDTDSVAALRRFQADQNLTPDGKLGALSLIALGLGPNRDAATAVVAKPDASQ